MADLALALEQKVLKTLMRQVRCPRRVLIAVSGGLDSVVMGEILSRWHKHLRWELAVAHVHHGAVEGGYRDQAQAFVRAWADAHGWAFYTNRPEQVALKSELDLREYRQVWLKTWMRDKGFELCAFAHHRDDLLETRMLRLIRGTGTQGLKAMRVFGTHSVRPLLALSRAEVAAYAGVRKLQWLEDPSNISRHPLRNWLRHEWLPQLETRQPGAGKALARSLEHLAKTQEPFTTMGPYVGLRREAMNALSFVRKQAVVAQYLRSLDVRGYGETHVDELLKRLDTDRKSFDFEMLGLKFHVTHDLLWASRV